MSAKLSSFIVYAGETQHDEIASKWPGSIPGSEGSGTGAYILYTYTLIVRGEAVNKGVS